MSSLWLVIIYSVIAAIATGLGAVPFVVLRSISVKQVAIFSLIAAGLMTGASLDLLYEGWKYNLLTNILGLIAGIVFIILIQKAIKGLKRFEPEELLSVSGQRMIVILIIMTAHSFAEGISIGFSFGVTKYFGVLIVAAMAFQNIPEGLAIAAALSRHKVSPWRSAGWAIFSSLPQPLMAIPAYISILFFRPLLPLGLGFAAGTMLWIVMDELLPTAREQLPKITIGSVLIVSVMVMLTIVIL